MVVIRPKQILHRPGEPLEYVYFPNGGVFSVTTLLPNGTAVEAATVGDEGMVGIEAFFSDDAVAPGQNQVMKAANNAGAIVELQPLPILLGLARPGRRFANFGCVGDGYLTYDLISCWISNFDNVS